MKTPAHVHRFPKWLRQESYTIAHDAGTPGRFLVTLIRGEKRHIGHGPTISQAARRASHSITQSPR